MAASSIAAEHRFVVGVDGSEPSKAALRWAARLAEATGGTIEAVTAWQMPVTFGWAYVPDYHPDQDATKILAEAVEAVFGANRPAGMRLSVDEGNPAKVLLEHSAGAQMLIVGSRGHGGFVGLLLGSVSANCAEHATCPVLVIHGTTEVGNP